MKILVLCLPGIGDALMATPMIRALQCELPSASIDVACMFHGVEYVFENNPHVRRVHYLPLYKEPVFSSFEHVFRLRRERYDVSIVTFPAFRKEYHAVARLIAARKRVAHRFTSGTISEWHCLNTDLVRVDDGVHNVINDMNLLHALGIQWEDKFDPRGLRYDLELEADAATFGTEYLQTVGFGACHVVGVHPGSIDSKAGVYKRWPSECWVELIDELTTNRDRNVLVFYGDLEKDVAARIVGSAKDPARCKAVSGLSFKETLGVVSQVDALVSNDNGFAHLANALGIKGVVLFGPTNMTWCAPYARELAVSLRRAAFTPWFVNEMKVTNPPRDARGGMEAIRVDDVLDALRQLGVVTGIEDPYKPRRADAP